MRRKVELVALIVGREETLEVRGRLTKCKVAHCNSDVNDDEAILAVVQHLHQQLVQIQVEQRHTIQRFKRQIRNHAEEVGEDWVREHKLVVLVLEKASVHDCGD